MRDLSLIIFALVAILPSTVLAANPLDLVATPIQEHVNTTPGDISVKAMEHLVEGNLTKEHISQDVNVTKEQLKKDAVEHINQNLNISPEQLEQRAKEELKNQVNQKVQQPGFEYALALAGILGATLILNSQKR